MEIQSSTAKLKPALKLSQQALVFRWWQVGGAGPSSNQSSQQGGLFDSPAFKRRGGAQLSGYLALRLFFFPSSVGKHSWAERWIIIFISLTLFAIVFINCPSSVPLWFFLSNALFIFVIFRSGGPSLAARCFLRCRFPFSVTEGKGHICSCH